MAALKLIPDLNDLRSSEDSLNKLIPKIKGNGKYMYGFGFVGELIYPFKIICSRILFHSFSLSVA